MLADGVLGAARRLCCVVRSERGASDFGAQVERLSGAHVPMVDRLAVSSGSSPGSARAQSPSLTVRGCVPTLRYNVGIATLQTIR